MGKLTISMAIFNSYVTNYQRVYPINILLNHYKSPFFITGYQYIPFMLEYIPAPWILWDKYIYIYILHLPLASLLAGF